MWSYYFLFAAGAPALAAIINPASPTNLVALQSAHGRRGHGGSSRSGEPGAAAVIPRGDSEHVVLADCKAPDKNYFQSSQMAYYAGSPNDAPDATTIVSSGKQQAWAGSGKITGVFSDNVAFTVEIPVAVGEGQFAGSGHNGYAAFSCYARFKKALYTTENGTICNGIYDCDRTSPPGELSNRTPCSQPRLRCLLLIRSVVAAVSSSSLQSSTTTPPAALTAPTAALTTLATADSTSTQPGGSPSTSSSGAPAATAIATGTDDGNTLTKAQQIAIGVTVSAVGVVVAILAWLFPIRKNTSGGRRLSYRFSHDVVVRQRTRQHLRIR